MGAKELGQYMKEDYKNQASGWTKSLHQDEIDGMSITVYQRPLDGSRTHMTRSDIVYKNISLESCMNNGQIFRAVAPVNEEPSKKYSELEF
mmetsp:Transcript_26424/g.40348  ORF Transcript_26424/g.40348 Transcript_26424/m.40348 type:complete len:91 (+) Transcript_26424:471-743(+)